MARKIALASGDSPPAEKNRSIELVLIGALQRHQKNTRVHSRKQIKKIAASIKQFGFLIPALVDDNNIIICGHARVEAARTLGRARVPVIRAGHLTDAQKRAYMIADNKLADESAFDRTTVGLELLELQGLLSAEGLDITITGFDIAEIDLLAADLESAETEPADQFSEVPAFPVSRPGDLWLAREHRVACGDARDSAQVALVTNGKSVSAMFTDPPYNVPASAIGGRGAVQHRDFAFAAGEMSKDQFQRFLAESIRNAISASALGAVHYIFMDWRHIDDLIAVGRANYGEMLNLIVWNKTNAGQGSLYRSQHELIAVFRVGSHPHRNNVEHGRHGRNRSNVWTYPGVNTFGRDRAAALASHPTVKPVALVADALLDCTARGDAVLDPFLGSGTTLIAAEKVGRVCFGVEYEPAYVDVAIRRWQSFTKLEAVLAGDGRTFDEVAAARHAENGNG